MKTWASRECAELFSPFSSFDGYSQRCSFPIQRNREKASTREFDAGIFKQPGPISDMAYLQFNPIGLFLARVFAAKC
jgi:hypothetical protein